MGKRQTKLRSRNTTQDDQDEPTKEVDMFSTEQNPLSHSLRPVSSINDGTINALERKALTEMITYVASTQTVTESIVCEILATHHGISDLQLLKARDYHNAIAFLIDLDVCKVMN